MNARTSGAGGVAHDSNRRVFLFAWLTFAALLAVLALLLLGLTADPDGEAERQPKDPSAVD